jgi:hypothetical protein
MIQSQAPRFFQGLPRMEPLTDQNGTFIIVQRVMALMEEAEPRLITQCKMYQTDFFNRPQTTILAILLIGRAFTVLFIGGAKTTGVLSRREIIVIPNTVIQFQSTSWIQKLKVIWNQPLKRRV